jgi:hypothetical protein
MMRKILNWLPSENVLHIFLLIVVLSILVYFFQVAHDVVSINNF